MMARRQKSTAAPETFRGDFNAFPRAVEHSAAVISLSDPAYRLLHAALDMHRGANNGHIALTLAKLAPYGWNSKDKLTRATRELLDRELLILTRQGGMGVGPSLFALGWLHIHDFKGLDIGPKSYRQGAWLDFPSGGFAGPPHGPGNLPQYEKTSETLGRLTDRQRTVSRSGAGPSHGPGNAPLDRLPVQKPPKKLNRPDRLTGTVTTLPVAAGNSIATEPPLGATQQNTDPDPAGMVG